MKAARVEIYKRLKAASQGMADNVEADGFSLRFWIYHREFQNLLAALRREFQEEVERETQNKELTKEGSEGI